MELTLTTPALLFPTVSLVLLAYTNRFLAVAGDDHDKRIVDQIKSLRIRVHLIRNMQMFSIFALFLSVLCMFSLFYGEVLIAKFIFSGSLISLLISLGMSLREIYLSTHALAIQLKDMDDAVNS